MGVDRNDYVIVGYKMPYDVKFRNVEKLSKDLWDNEKYLPLIEGWVGEVFTLIPDGMSGGYIAFGKQLASADEYDGFDFLELSINESDLEDTKQKATELFGDLDFDFSNPKVLVFSHYH